MKCFFILRLSVKMREYITLNIIGCQADCCRKICLPSSTSESANGGVFKVFYCVFCLITKVFVSLQSQAELKTKDGIVVSNNILILPQTANESNPGPHA